MKFQLLSGSGCRACGSAGALVLRPSGKASVAARFKIPEVLPKSHSADYQSATQQTTSLRYAVLK
jgi:hypothetical protein